MRLRGDVVSEMVLLVLSALAFVCGVRLGCWLTRRDMVFGAVDRDVAVNDMAEHLGSAWAEEDYEEIER